MLITISIILICAALIFSIEDARLATKNKYFLIVGVASTVLFFKNEYYSIFIACNYLILQSLAQIKNSKVRVSTYLVICFLVFYASTIGSFLNETFTTFFFSEDTFICNSIYYYPVVLYSLLLTSRSSHKAFSFDFNNLLRLVISLGFMIAIGYPLEKTFDSLQSLNFVQSLSLILSGTAVVYLSFKILNLFHIQAFSSFFKSKKESVFLIIGGLAIVHPSMLHLFIGVILALMTFYTGNKLKILKNTITYIGLGLLLLPDFDSIKIAISGLLSLQSIFLYYNELYILNSIGADLTLIIPLYLLLFFWLSNDRKPHFNLRNKKDEIKVSQFIILCVFILFIL